MPRMKKNDAEQELYREWEKANTKNTDESPAEVETNGPETKNGTVANALNVNLRSEPSFDTNNVIEILKKGDKVIILDSAKEFYKVSTSTNRIGYIASDFIKEE